MEGLGRRQVRKKDMVEKERSVWTEEGIKHYHEECKVEHVIKWRREKFGRK